MSHSLLRTSSFIQAQLRTDLPDFTVGSVITVSYKIKEGEKERIQDFKGIVTNRKGGKSLDATFTLTKNSFAGIKVERTFALHSPLIEKIEINLLQRSRRANINQLAFTRKDYAKSGRFKTQKSPETSK